MESKTNQTITNNNLPKTLLQAKLYSQFITIPQTTINYEELHNSLGESETVQYLLTKLEQHEDKGLHIHILIKFNTQQRISWIHNRIMAMEGDIGGLIDYQAVKKIQASVLYLKKEETSIEGKPFLEKGTLSSEHGSNQFKKQDNSQAILEAIQKAETGDVEGALEDIKQSSPMDYLKFKQTINDTLKSENKTVKKWDLPNYSQSHVKLNKQQQQVWDLLQTAPKARRIIWVSGDYGSGKSFLYNYIKENYEYRMYDAGQSASMDNVAYGYDEEGVIAWDLPRTYNFTEMGDTIASVIEKFSDFGQSITSKKYSGKTQKVRGHTLVFSNQKPIDQLSHRDVIHINLSEKEEPLKVSTAYNPEAIYIPEDLRANREVKTPFVSSPKTSKVRYNTAKQLYEVLHLNECGFTRLCSYKTREEAEEDLS